MYIQQFTVAAQGDFHKVSILVASKGVIPSISIMSYHKYQWILDNLLDFRNLLLNNLQILIPAKCMNDEYVEQGVH